MCRVAWICGVLLTCFTGCASVPAPSGPERSVVGLEVDLAIGGGSVPAHKLFLLRIEDEASDPRGTVFGTNHTIGRYGLLVDAEPGRYAAIAGVFSWDPAAGVIDRTPAPTLDTTVEGGQLRAADPGVQPAVVMPPVWECYVLFSAEQVRNSITSVEPTSLTFMGHFQVLGHEVLEISPWSYGSGEWLPQDPTLREYWSQIRESLSFDEWIDLEAAVGFERDAVCTGTEHTLARDTGEENLFLDAARKPLEEAGWSSVLPALAGE